MRYKIYSLLLLVTVFGGLLLRLYESGSIPPSPNWDQVSIGYNAYSLIKTGKDEWGMAVPVIFRAFGDYKLPLYLYAAVPTIWAFGLSDLATKLPSMLAGVLLIAVVYIISRKLALSRQMSLVSSLLVVFEPWTWFFSRMALEANLAVLVMAIAAGLLLSKKFNLSMIFFGLTVWTYNSFRIFTPLFLVSLLLTNYRAIYSSFVRLAILVLFLIPMFIQLLSPGGQSRLTALNIINPGVVGKIEEQRNASNLPNPLKKLVYNRPVEFIKIFLSNYFSYFSPSFLFLDGGNHYQFSVQKHGLFFALSLPFFYLGAFLVLKHRKTSPNLFILLLWLILAPIPGSLVRDAPHTTRAVTMLPLPIILSAIGMRLLGKLSFIPILLLPFFFLNFYQKARDYSFAFSKEWQYGHKQLVDVLRPNYTKYDSILMTKRYGEPHEFILYYWPWSPGEYQVDLNKNWDYHANWYWVNSFGKFKFVNDWDMKEASKFTPPNTLIVSSPENLPFQSHYISTIRFLDGAPAFIISSK